MDITAASKWQPEAASKWQPEVARAYQSEGVERALLAQLQDGVGHMVVEGAQHPLPQALLGGNVQALHEHVQGFLVLPLTQQTHPLSSYFHCQKQRVWNNRVSAELSMWCS